MPVIPFPQPVMLSLRQHGYTQLQAAAAIGCSLTYLSHVVNGRCRPSLRIATALSKLLGADITELFYEWPGLSVASLDQVTIAKLATLPDQSEVE